MRACILIEVKQTLDLNMLWNARLWHAGNGGSEA